MMRFGRGERRGNIEFDILSGAAPVSSVHIDPMVLIGVRWQPIPRSVVTQGSGGESFLNITSLHVIRVHMGSSLGIAMRELQLEDRV